MHRLLAPLALLFAATVPAYAQTVEGDAILKDFAFANGEKLPELKIHYTTLGTPRHILFSEAA